ncbi:MAG: pentapeptide repeat-containing protein [Chloroflexota bacterium]|nr:pentapeptide repeat-containing protein [Chloroflexota bacterium]
METLLVGVIIFLLVAAAGVLLVLRLQKQYMEQARSQQKAWERALESRLRSWEQRHEKISAELEQNLLLHIEQAKNSFARQHTRTVTQLGIELELSKLPNTDETPIIMNQDGRASGLPANWRPAALYRANLVKHDLSHRYLGRADLRGAQLMGANFYMADLSGACLAGANLSEADLSGTNLARADLRNATLAGASLLVADLQGTNLTGADLTNVRHLTAEQLRTVVYDDPPLPQPEPVVEDTQNTQLRMKAIRPATAPPRHIPAQVEKAAPVPSIRRADVPDTEDILAPLSFEEVEEEDMQPTIENVAVQAGVARLANGYETSAETTNPSEAEEEIPPVSDHREVAGLTETPDPLSETSITSEAPIALVEEPAATDAMVAAAPAVIPADLSETLASTRNMPAPGAGETTETGSEITDSDVPEEDKLQGHEITESGVPEDEPQNDKEDGQETELSGEPEQEAMNGPLERPLMLSELDMQPFVSRLLNDLPPSSQVSNGSLLDPEVTDLLLVRSPEGGS